MKITEQMRYPHPVLTLNSDDYSNADFKVAFTRENTTDGKLKLKSTITIDCDSLKNLIDSQRVKVGYFIICRRTYFNSLQVATLGESEKYLELSKLYETVSLRPVAWTTEEITNYASPAMHSEFGNGVPIAVGNLVAMGPEFRFSVDPERFKPFETVFQIAKDDTLEPDMYFVDADRDKITILAERNTYQSIVNMRDVAQGKLILLNSVFMPAIMDVVARLQAGDASLHGKRWYRVFRAKCDELGIDPTVDSHSPLTIAQRLLKQPLRGTIKTMETI